MSADKAQGMIRTPQTEISLPQRFSTQKVGAIHDADERR